MSADLPNEQHAAEQTAANARLEGIELHDDEQQLVARRRGGEITHEQFLEQAREIAIRKAGEQL
jgi:hypothetical protein